MEYDDFAIISPDDMDRVAKEYTKMLKIKEKTKNRVVFEDKTLILSYFNIIQDKLEKVKKQLRKEDYIAAVEILKRNYLKLSGLLGEINKNQVNTLVLQERKNVIELLVELINKLIEKSEHESIKEIVKELLSIFILLS